MAKQPQNPILLSLASLSHSRVKVRVRVARVLWDKRWSLRFEGVHFIGKGALIRLRG
jgi:hypothetical protein